MSGLLPYDRMLVVSIMFLVLSAAIFVPLEEALRTRPRPRASLKDILCFWFYPSFGLWISASLLFRGVLAVRGVLPIGWVTAVHGQPQWLQFGEALILAETWTYSAHRLAHRVSFLWRFHKVHHTITDMTWTTTFRQHPIDFALIVLGQNLPAMLMGIDLRPIAVLIACERLWTIALHSNFEFGLGRLGAIIAGPDFHHDHHRAGRHGCNYAGILSLLDRVGGSRAVKPAASFKA